MSSSKDFVTVISPNTIGKFSGAVVRRGQEERERFQRAHGVIVDRAVTKPHRDPKKSKCLEVHLEISKSEAQRIPEVIARLVTV